MARDISPAEGTMSPLAQGLATGALTLIPVRTYPPWLTAGLTVGAPAVFAGAVVAVMLRSKVPAPDSWSNEGGTDPELRTVTREVTKPGEIQSDPPSQWLAAAVVAVTGGAAVYGLTRFSLWADGASERWLQARGVPRPRLTMAVAAGVLTSLTAWAEREGYLKGSEQDARPPA